MRTGNLMGRLLLYLPMRTHKRWSEYLHIHSSSLPHEVSRIAQGGARNHSVLSRCLLWLKQIWKPPWEIWFQFFLQSYISPQSIHWLCQHGNCTLVSQSTGNDVQFKDRTFCFFTLQIHILSCTRRFLSNNQQRGTRLFTPCWYPAILVFLCQVIFWRSRADQIKGVYGIFFLPTSPRRPITWWII